MQDDTTTLARRVAAVERALTGQPDVDLDDLSDAAALERRVADVETTLDAIAGRVDELDARIQAVCGLAEGVRAVDRDVGRRADLALAKAEALEAEVLDAGRGPLRVERLPVDGVGADSVRGTDRGAAAGGGERATDADENAADGGTDEGAADSADPPLVDRLRAALEP